ncbi:hypothetical protein CWATWH0003_4646b4, partial [Crocosphaera watsonii WH 0003]
FYSAKPNYIFLSLFIIFSRRRINIYIKRNIFIINYF